MSLLNKVFLLTTFLFFTLWVDCQTRLEEYIEIELARIEETYNLLDSFSERIWPGWNNYDSIQFQVQFPDKTLLKVLPSEASMFDCKLITQHILRNQVCIKDGEQLIDNISLPLRGYGGPISYNPSIIRIWLEQKGEQLVCEEFQNKNTEEIDNCASLLEICSESQILMYVHELFHMHQNRIWKDMHGVDVSSVFIPQSEYGVYSEIEGEALTAAYVARDTEKVKRFLKDYLIAHELKKEYMPENIKTLESNRLIAEGIAQYASIKIAMIVKSEEYTPAINQSVDPYFMDYKLSDKYIHQSLFSLMDSLKGDTFDLIQKCYVYGAYLSFILDRIQPGWKEQFFEKNKTFESVLRGICHITDQDREFINKRFSKYYQINDLFNKHISCVKQRDDALLAVENRAGRKYIIDFSSKRELVHLTPTGKSYRIGPRVVLPSGFRRLTTNDFELTSANTVFNCPLPWLLEWIDVERPNNRKGYYLEYRNITNGILKDIVFETSGFKLTATSAEIHANDTSVTIILR